MPSYPIEPDKLLDAAELLAPAATGPGRPPYTAHRRAVSTAYYAVFHAITTRVAAQAFPNADAQFLRRVRRWIAHGDIKAVARWVSQLQGTSAGQPPPHIKALLAPAGGAIQIDAHTAAIADGFLELNEKREQADYDHEAVFPRADTRGLIALAHEVVSRVEAAQSGEATCLLRTGRNAGADSRKVEIGFFAPAAGEMRRTSSAEGSGRRAFPGPLALIVPKITMAAMAALDVRSSSLPFARPIETRATERSCRTYANARERPPLFAMQKVVGSSPIIRSQKAPETRGFYRQ